MGWTWKWKYDGSILSVLFYVCYLGMKLLSFIRLGSWLVQFASFFKTPSWGACCDVGLVFLSVMSLNRLNCLDAFICMTQFHLDPCKLPYTTRLFRRSSLRRRWASCRVQVVFACSGEPIRPSAPIAGRRWTNFISSIKFLHIWCKSTQVGRHVENGFLPFQAEVWSP